MRTFDFIHRWTQRTLLCCRLFIFFSMSVALFHLPSLWVVISFLFSPEVSLILPQSASLLQCLDFLPLSEPLHLAAFPSQEYLCNCVIQQWVIRNTQDPCKKFEYNFKLWKEKFGDKDTQPLFSICLFGEPWSHKRVKCQLVGRKWRVAAMN